MFILVIASIYDSILDRNVEEIRSADYDAPQKLSPQRR